MTNLPAPSTAIQCASLADLSSAGALVAQAGFLGAKNPAEGFLVLATCQQEALSLVKFQQKYHFFQGRFSMEAHSILAEFVARGGTYKLIERTQERAALLLSKDGNEYLSEVTWADCQEEPFVYRGNPSEQMAQLSRPVEQRTVKDKYATPRSRMQMLWSRAISDGVVVVDPGVRGGVYPPEITDDFTVYEKNITPQDAPAAPAGTRQGSPKTAPVTGKPMTAEQAQEAIDVMSREVASVDPSTCPIPGMLYGKPWAELTREHLQFVLDEPSQCDGVTEAHLVEIRNLIGSIA